MGGANNAVSDMRAYLIQGTAATNVSTVTAVKTGAKTSQEGFDSILTKANQMSRSSRQPNINDATVKPNTDKNATDNKRADSAQTKDITNRDVQTKDAKTRDVQTDDKDVQTQDVKSENANTADQNEQEVKSEVNEPMEVIEVPEEIAITELPEMTEETVSIVADSKLQEAITQDSRILINKLSEIFEVSEDEIVDAMQVLGLMAADLLDPQNLSQMVTELTGEEMAIDIITDSDIYTSLQDLMEGAESMNDRLMNEFGISEEELKAAIEENKNTFNVQTESGNEKAKEPEIIIENRNFSSNVESEAPQLKKTQAPQSEAFTDEKPAEEKPIEINTESSKNSENEKSFSDKGDQTINLFNQLVNNIADAASEVDGTLQGGYTQRAQMENIVRQITEKITISAGSEETTMELSLHPASLGNVNILLSSGKDGIVAKFTAQNQIVKEAVEAQMVQLQQKFSEQGIKVTSIEVTVASHSFEQNLEQGNDRQSKEAERGRNGRSLRRLNISEIDDEDLDKITGDAERIAVQMMAANGNSVDYSA